MTSEILETTDIAAAPECTYCAGAGVVHPLLVDGTTDFSNLIYCPACSFDDLKGVKLSAPIYAPAECRHDFACSYGFRQFYSESEGVYLPDLKPFETPEKRNEPDKTLDELYERVSALEEGFPYEGPRHRPQKLNDDFKLHEMPKPKIRITGGVAL